MPSLNIEITSEEFAALRQVIGFAREAAQNNCETESFPQPALDEDMHSDLETADKWLSAGQACFESLRRISA
jgi:hypothetical protein